MSHGHLAGTLDRLGHGLGFAQHSQTFDLVWLLRLLGAFGHFVLPIVSPLPSSGLYHHRSSSRTLAGVQFGPQLDFRLCLAQATLTYATPALYVTECTMHNQHHSNTLHKYHLEHAQRPWLSSSMFVACFIWSNAIYLAYLLSVMVQFQSRALSRHPEYCSIQKLGCQCRPFCSTGDIS